MGLGLVWLGTRYSPSQPPPYPHTPGTPLPYPHPPWTGVHHAAGTYGGANSAVGLRSVDRLSLSDHFSGFEGMTEGYNLALVGRINNHLAIAGND